MESTKSAEPSAITSQPGATNPPAPGAEEGLIHIRNMEAQDIDLVAPILVEAFHDKVEHVVGKSGMEDMARLTASALTRSPYSWHRYYVAMYDGKLAGILVIKFHDSTPEDFGTCDTCSHLGCWGTCRMTLLGLALTNSQIGTTQCYVDTVGVDAAFRGKGIGTAILNKADAEARQRGCTTTFLWVTQHNRAVRLYERHGYVVTHPFGNCFTQCAVGTRDWYNMEKQL